MFGSIRNQILIPFACLQGVAIAVISALAAWSAVDRAERDTIARLNQVVGTLSTASFPVRGNVLEQMKGLSGAEFIAIRGSNEIVSSTLSDEQARSVLQLPRAASSGTGELSEFQTIQTGQTGAESFLVGGVTVMRSPDLSELIVLVPEQQWQTIRREVVFPPLLIGGLAMVATVGLSYLLAARFGRRLNRMERQVGRLASLQFEELLPIGGHDELTRLATSINSMAIDLQQATEQIRLAERTTVVTQVAGGLAHQLRNSITGARMAVQLHLRRCNHADQESLNVALRQLNLTESQIRGLLSLTRDSQQTPVRGSLSEILNDIRSLLAPQFEHSSSEFELTYRDAAEATESIAHAVAAGESDGRDWQVDDRDQIHAALLNLVQNALEACRPNGRVRVMVRRENQLIVAEILDDGPGVPEDLQNRIFEPFVTGKPEGVGLGLTLAAQVAQSAGGRLSFDRRDGWTVFRFEIPVTIDGVRAMT
jgi:signal transduction histidine kinase